MSFPWPASSKRSVCLLHDQRHKGLEVADGNAIVRCARVNHPRRRGRRGRVAPGVRVEQRAGDNKGDGAIRLRVLLSRMATVLGGNTMRTDGGIWP